MPNEYNKKYCEVTNYIFVTKKCIVKYVFKVLASNTSILIILCINLFKLFHIYKLLYSWVDLISLAQQIFFALFPILL